MDSSRSRSAQDDKQEIVFRIRYFKLLFSGEKNLLKKNHPFIINQLPAILWAFLIFALSSIPGKNLPHIGLFPNADKIIHAGLFFVFCGLAHRAFRYQPNRLLVQLSLFFALVATVMYGCSDEFHQLCIMGRTADIYDMLADIFGGVLYATFFMMIMRPRLKPESKPIGS